MPRTEEWKLNGLLAAGVLFLLMGVLVGASAAKAGGPGVAKYDESSFEVFEESGMAVITVERSHGEDGAVSVDYRTAADTATDGLDYNDVAGTLTWSHGDGTSKTFIVPLLNDAEAEGAESVQLILENPSGGMDLDQDRAVASLIILASDGGSGGDDNGGDDNGGDDNGGDDNGGDDNGGDDNGGDDNGGGGGGGGGGSGVIKLGSGAFQVLESSGPAIIRVERSQGETGLVSVDYQLAGGTATAGQDYSDVSGTLTWVSGDGADETLLVPIINDGEAEGNETFEVLLSNVTGGASLHPARNQAVVTILDGGSGQSACTGGGNSLCLLDGRFQVDIAWRDAANRVGDGRPMALSDKSGLFWFFNNTNFEVLVKMVDACDAFGANWLFFSSTTNVELDITVRDTRTGLTRTFHNPLGQAAAPVIDVSSFTGCD